MVDSNVSIPKKSIHIPASSHRISNMGFHKLEFKILGSDSIEDEHNNPYNDGKHNNTYNSSSYRTHDSLSRGG